MSRYSLGQGRSGWITILFYQNTLDTEVSDALIEKGQELTPILHTDDMDIPLLSQRDKLSFAVYISRTPW
jgi:hypothetical protein